MRGIPAALTLAATLAACAGRPPAGTATTPAEASALARGGRAAARPPTGRVALEVLRGELEGHDARAKQAAQALGIDLASGLGERQLTGEPARDDEVAAVAVVTHLADSAALLVRTECGNAHLVAVHWERDRWARTDAVGLVTDAHPGACRTTDAHADSRALVTDEQRDLIVVFSSQSEDGDEARDPVLRVYRLTGEARFEPLLGAVPYGSTDDVTGAATHAQWVVDDVLPPPRDLYVEITPWHPGPGGQAPAEIIRRVYRLRGGALQLDQEVTEALRPRQR